MPRILKGNCFRDDRGVITYNNDFDTSVIKRIYTIENHTVDFQRGWQGHKIERRWFASIQGSFEISVIKLDDFRNPKRLQRFHKFVLTDKVLDYLYVPPQCVTAIRAIESKSKLLVLADYFINEIRDEYRFEIDTFIPL